jgi:lipoprotein-anchoring transpeptidase ErfK/SrfK
MKKIFRRLTVSVLVFILLVSLGSAFAVRTDYADIQGHWAENTLIRALNDTLIDAAGDSLRPNDPLTSAEMLTILCKVLSAKRTADLSGITGIGKDDPILPVASQAVALGFVTPVNGRLDMTKTVTRGKAMTVLAEAFQLIGAQPDMTVLSKYSDGNSLSGAYRSAAASLISRGFVGGIGGALHMDRNISRAEFITVLYNILPEYKKDVKGLSSVPGGAVFSGETTLSDTQFSGGVYFDCSSSGVRLQNITAPSVTLRSDSLGTLSLYSCKIDRLVFASGSGDMFFNPGFSSDITTAVIGTGGGKITLGGIQNVEVTGSNREVVVTGSVKSLLVSGSNNKITVASGAAVNSVKIAMSGSGNTVTVGGLIKACDIFGSNTVLNGTGTVQELLDNSKGSSITVSADNTAVNNSYGLNDVEVTLAAPENLSAYEKLTATVSIKAPEDSRICRGAWYIDGAFISQSQVDLGTTDAVSLEYAIKNTGDAPSVSTLSFILSYSDSGGNYQEIRVDKAVTVQSPTKFDTAEVLALVTTGYKGDYSLVWAQANDYDDAIKTAWVNMKSYSSKTDYLVWVNITHQRVNVFSGSAGNWNLEKTFIVGTGASGRDTPTGVFKVIGRSTRGWTTKAYTVKPVIFFLNSAYGFHSRLYAPGTTNVTDARIGFPVSHGCVRMYDEDVAWIYDNIPTNTTVVVY